MTAGKKKQKTSQASPSHQLSHSFCFTPPQYAEVSSAYFTAISERGNHGPQNHTARRGSSSHRRRGSRRARRAHARTATGSQHSKTGLQKWRGHELCPLTPLSALALALLTALREEKHGFPCGTSAPALSSPLLLPALPVVRHVSLPGSLLTLRGAGRREDPYTASREASDCSVASPALPLFLGENESGFESQGGGARASSEPRRLRTIPARPALSAAGSGTPAPSC